MLKRVLALLLALLCVAGSVVACDNQTHTHAYGEWAVEKEASCVTEGVRARACTCGDKQTIPIESTGEHTFGTDGKCTVCTHEHTFGVWKALSLADCGTNGIERRSCACGEYELRVVTATAEHTCGEDGKCTTCGHEHAFGEWHAVDSVCGKAGLKLRACACGYLESEEIPATTAHVYGEWTQTSAPACGVAGTKIRVCSCGHVESEEIPATTAHVYGEWRELSAASCEASGIKIAVCSCGDVKADVTPATGHIWAEVDELTFCGACGEVHRHSLSELIITKPENCGVAGEEMCVCLFCGEKFVNERYATGEHSYNNEGTCLVCGMDGGIAGMVGSTFGLYLSRMKGTLAMAGNAVNDPKYWDAYVSTDNITTADYYTSQVLESLKHIAAAMILYGECGLELPEATEEKIDAWIEELIKQDGGGSKDALNSILSIYGADITVLRTAAILEAKLAQLKEHLYGANGSLIAEFAIEEYYKATYYRGYQMQIANWYYNEYGIPTFYTPAEMEARYQLVLQIAAECVNDEAKFLQYVREFSDNSDFNNTYAPNGMYFSVGTYSADTMLDTFSAELANLKVGEISVLSSDSGYYVLMRVELDTGAWKNEANAHWFTTLRALTLEYMLQQRTEQYLDQVIFDEMLLKEIDIASVGANVRY